MKLLCKGKHPGNAEVLSEILVVNNVDKKQTVRKLAPPQLAIMSRHFEALLCPYCELNLT